MAGRSGLRLRRDPQPGLPCVSYPQTKQRPWRTRNP